MSQIIVKRVKFQEDVEEVVMEQQVFVKDTFVNPLNTIVVSRALAKVMEDNMASMTHQVKEQNVEIARIKAKLEQYKKLTTTLVINTISFNNFIGYAQAVEDEIHAA